MVAIAFSAIVFSVATGIDAGTLVFGGSGIGLLFTTGSAGCLASSGVTTEGTVGTGGCSMTGEIGFAGGCDCWQPLMTANTANTANRLSVNDIKSVPL
jgi:hypothetical protein